MRAASALVLVVELVAAVAGCAPPGSSEPNPTPDITSPVEGIVIAVDSAGLGQVQGFTLRPTSDSYAFGFVIGTLENATEFPPGHLAEHQASSEPIRVYFRTEGGEHVVYRLEDAADPPGG